jgi:outer membrane receptor for ferrienterochelin and colicins
MDKINATALLLLLLILYCPFLSAAGDSMVRLYGTITTSDGQAAEYIQVFLKNTRYGTQTDNSGYYSFKAPAGKYLFVAHSITCHRKETEIHISEENEAQLFDFTIIENERQLADVVVTGQMSPQSMHSSVFKLKSINSESISNSGARELKTLLESQLGIRFQTDLTTGESDIQIMGMSGQNVKILLDGVPMVDRGSRRQSLSHIDINSIERIEIVEGPMSVQYGTDALAGVINIITKTGYNRGKPVSVTLSVTEETVGSEYQPFAGKGMHSQHVSASVSGKKGLYASTGLTHNQFGGFHGDNTGRAKSWKPREQWLANARIGRKCLKSDLWLRTSFTDETIKGEGNVNELTGVATDKDFLTNRLNNELQGVFYLPKRNTLNLQVARQDYVRRTETSNYNTATGQRRLSLEPGGQDKSEIGSTFAKLTATKKASDKLSGQIGAELKHDKASGDRIKGEPEITDFSVFIAGEYTAWERLQLRPGVRSSFNSTYDAPPAVPSINAKLAITEKTDFRASYARGFRAPALRELHFWFFNANHSIKGNENLKAEHSDSYMASLTNRPLHSSKYRATLAVSGFYNQFKNLISTAPSKEEPGITTYVNIEKHKTAGSTLDASFNARNFLISCGLSMVGRKSQYAGATSQKLPAYNWSPEATASLSYTVQKPGTVLSLSYKFTGKRPFHELITEGDTQTINEAYIGAFHLADLTASQKIGKFWQAQAGVKNLLDVKSVRNTSLVTGGHSTSGPTPITYGRSFFVSLSFNL